MGIILDTKPTSVSIAQKINDYFHTTVAQKNCDGCSVNGPHDWNIRIEAAPQILKVRLNIFRNDATDKWVGEGKNRRRLWRHYKLLHALRTPNTIDLTNHQMHNFFPLRYTLNSVTSHSGNKGTNGHYITSTRGQGGQINCISDSNMEAFSQAQLQQSPQAPLTVSTSKFQVYVLTYLRDDVPLTSLRRKAAKLMPELRNKKL